MAALMRRGRGTAAAGAGAILLAGWLAGDGARAQEGALAPFFGTYVGVAEVQEADGEVSERRHMDIVIEPYDEAGFRLEWVNVSLVDGRRDVPGVERRVQAVYFEPAEAGDFFVESAEENPFREREQTEPMRGDPVRWARIDGDQLEVYSFVVRDDGRYEMQIYERSLTGQGMDIEFQRLVDGELVRRIVGTTARADSKADD